ncbi:MAG: thioredoxin-disulfide reductase, partial [Candidatus Omnitrophica bacterium]|nr:thioredoxin-disulfide reductase [Candidatus Omnitrophota bacterium]
MSLVTHDLIIIGAGPAGLTAGLYAGRSRLKTMILEKLSVGGRILLTERIENYPGFVDGIITADLIKRIEEQVKKLEVKIKPEEVLELDCKSMSVKSGSKTYSAHAIIIATGAHPKRLGIIGEEKFTGRGVSYCATCDGAFYKEKSVVIIGGGNSMAEEALFLTRFAKQVNIVHRRSELRASAVLQERLKKNKKINFVLNSVVSEIIGSNKVESVKIKDMTSGEERVLPCEGVFIYVGYAPETQFIKEKLKLDDTGFIITQDDLSTSAEGIFACGDCRKKALYQVITACGDGATAADSAY